MKKEVSPAVIASVIAVIVVLLIFVAYKTFFPNTDVSPNSPADKKAYQERMAKDAAMYQRLGHGNANRATGASGTPIPQANSGGN